MCTKLSVDVLGCVGECVCLKSETSVCTEQTVNVGDEERETFRTDGVGEFV